MIDNGSISILIDIVINADHVICQFFISQSESSNSCTQLDTSVGRKFFVSLENGDVTMMPTNFSARTQRS